MDSAHAEDTSLTKEQKVSSTYHVQPHYSTDPDLVEIGVDEVGRGPLFGRVYTAAVILPKPESGTSFDFSLLKDSKKFSSKKKIKEAYDHIVENCVDYVVNYEDEHVIDTINILQATQKSMHKCVQHMIDRRSLSTTNTMLLIDGNYFKDHTRYNKDRKTIESFKHMCVKGGDNLYGSIAAASIVAKIHRDEYILNLCEENPVLDERYSISTNKGYGAKKHLDGINTYGITKWHRKSFGSCKGKLVV